MPLFDLIALPFCKVLMVERWNEPPHRYFIAYRARADFRSVLGLPVIDEFATFSSPIFFASAPILGKIYNAGISLGHLRDREMSIDTGWPPLCVGTNEQAPDLPDKWEDQLLEQIRSFDSPSRSPVSQVNEYSLQQARIEEVAVYATNGPLLPKQLKRVCELSDSPFTIAFSTGNRIVRQQDATPLSVNVVSESQLSRILMAIQR